MSGVKLREIDLLAVGKGLLSEDGLAQLQFAESASVRLDEKNDTFCDSDDLECQLDSQDHDRTFEGYRGYKMSGETGEEAATYDRDGTLEDGYDNEDYETLEESQSMN